VTILFFYFPYPLPLPFKFVWIALWSPLLVYTGSKIRLMGKTRSIALLGGELSYPVYALHYPIFCWINGTFQVITKQQSVLLETPLIVAGVLLGSYFALKNYDEPLRKWLGRRATRPIPTRAAAR
jgi:peptidoglycan/LPS O-acetylase OafA/YrhL